MSEEVERELAGALGTALGSPASEFGALIADKIRFSRWKMGVSTLERAAKIAKEKGYSLSRPDLKFLVPFMEHCSLEEGDEQIQEFWAQLLVSAGVEFKAGHLLFMRLLREITGSEARLMHDIATNGGRVPNPHVSSLVDAKASWEMFGAPATPLRELASVYDWTNLKYSVFSGLETPGIAIETLTLLELRSGPNYEELESTYTSDTLLKGHSQISLDILQSLNVLEKHTHTYKPSKDSSGRNLRVEGTAFCFTAMGGTFFSECSGIVKREKS